MIVVEQNLFICVNSQISAFDIRDLPDQAVVIIEARDNMLVSIFARSAKIIDLQPGMRLSPAHIGKSQRQALSVL